MNNTERRDNGMAYIWDETLNRQYKENAEKLFRFNNTHPSESVELDRILRSILGKAGKNCSVRPPFHCDYGYNIEVGDNFFANFNLTILDVGKVIIGDNVFIGPGVSIFTAGHPIHYKARNSMYEYGIPVTIGSDCWICGNVTICPGVTIGERTVIGAGSVVTRDIPAGVIAAGNPCRVLREITEEDMKYYFRDRKFDDEAMKAVNEGGCADCGAYI